MGRVPTVETVGFEMSALPGLCKRRYDRMNSKSLRQAQAGTSTARSRDLANKADRKKQGERSAQDDKSFREGIWSPA